MLKTEALSRINAKNGLPLSDALRVLTLTLTLTLTLSTFPDAFSEKPPKRTRYTPNIVENKSGTLLT